MYQPSHDTDLPPLPPLKHSGEKLSFRKHIHFQRSDLKKCEYFQLYKKLGENKNCGATYLNGN